MTPDRIAGWATGIGIGAAIFIIAWTTFNRLFGMWMPVPEGQIAALTGAVIAGGGAALERGRTLSRRGGEKPLP